MSAYTVDRLIGLGLIWCAVCTLVVAGMYRLGKRRGATPTPPRVFVVEFEYVDPSCQCPECAEAIGLALLNEEHAELCREIEW